MKINTILQKTYDNSDKDSISIVTDIQFDGYTARVDTYVNDSDIECMSKLLVKSATGSVQVAYNGYANTRDIVLKGARIPKTVITTAVNTAIAEAKKAGRVSICGMIKALV